MSPLSPVATAGPATGAPGSSPDDLAKWATQVVPFMGHPVRGRAVLYGGALSLKARPYSVDKRSRVPLTQKAAPLTGVMGAIMCSLDVSSEQP